VGLLNPASETNPRGLIPARKGLKTEALANCSEILWFADEQSHLKRHGMEVDLLRAKNSISARDALMSDAKRNNGY
jgi:hypothetical protein